MKKPLLVSLILSLFISCDDSNENKVETETITVKIENTSSAKLALKSGVFNTPVGDTSAGAATAGKSYSVTFTAGKNSKLSFATMFVKSNDWFFAPKNGGLDLYDTNGKVSGDITSMIGLYDAATEIDQTPGSGADQPENQSATNTGSADSNTSVRIAEVPTGFPTIAELLKVTLISGDGYEFTLTIENISASSSLESAIAPGVFAIHSNANLLFTAGETDTSYGMEALAEDGNPSGFGTWLSAVSGVNTLITPGVYMLHKDGMPLFEVGKADYGNGLESIAEGGDNSVLGATATAFGDGPMSAGGSYTFTIKVEKGDYLSFATMFVESNDWIFSSPSMGLNLWNPDGSLKTGDYSSDVKFYDLGTEMDQESGVGSDQPLRGGGALNNGAVDSNTLIRAVTADDSPYKSHIKITISN
jgi:hypothetical protein